MQIKVETVALVHRFKQNFSKVKFETRPEFYAITAEISVLFYCILKFNKQNQKIITATRAKRDSLSEAPSPPELFE